MNTLTFAGGLGDMLNAANNLTKIGVGIMQFTAAATFGGTLTINAQSGTVLVSGSPSEGDLAAEVAAELGISVDVVYSAKSRVLRRLRQELDGLLD